MIHWLLHTDAGLFARILTGCMVFAALALADLQKNGENATRWREYSVLVVSVFVALFYGALNDQITVTISPEYFLHGKELEKIIGEHPSMPQLRWEAAKIGLKAAWSPGLAFGVALLLANNPYRGLPRLCNRSLIRYLPLIVIVTVIAAIVGGWAGRLGYLTKVDSDFKFMVDANVDRPFRFMAAWGVHLGGYLGGLVGTLLASGRVILSRLRLRAEKTSLQPKTELSSGN